MAEWLKRNRRGYLSSGATLLELILTPDGVDKPPAIDRRDAAVAASVIQWLGTNCGMGFIWTCEKKIDRARDIERDKRINLFELRKREADEQREAERRRNRPASRHYER